MGCSEGDPVCRSGEEIHEVALERFRIDAYEVSVGDYARCVRAGACLPPVSSAQLDKCNWERLEHENHPVNCVSLGHAEAYCTWRGGRLPSEAEWEKAARGTGGRLFPWGDDEPSCELTVMQTQDGPGCGRDDTWPVGSKPAGASPYGVQDMAGNVFEWTSTPSVVVAGAEGDTPRASSASIERRNVVRGGALYFSDAFVLRASLRASYPIEPGSIALGFRCVTDVRH